MEVMLAGLFVGVVYLAGPMQEVLGPGPPASPTRGLALLATMIRMRASLVVTGLCIGGALISFAMFAFAAAAATGVLSEPWDDASRVIAIVFGLLVGGLFAFLICGIARSCVAGRPRVTIEASGIRVDALVIPWADLGPAYATIAYGQSFLFVELDPTAVARLGWLDRLFASFNLRAGLPALTLSAQQLREPISSALARIIELRPAS